MNMERIEYIDFMKGIAIFLVVLGHVYQFCFKDTGQVFQFIYIFHMPFFFLLSGYFAQRTKVNVDFFKKKTISLLFPFVFGGSLFALLNGQMQAYIYSDFHAGYWFLWSLWHCWLLFALMLKIIEWLRIKHGVLQIGVLLLPFLISKLFDGSTPYGLSLSFTFAFYRFFILGYMIGKYKWMEGWLSKELVQAICLILFVLFYCMDDSVFVKVLPMTVVQVLLCLAFFSLLKYIYLVCNHKVVRYVIGGGKKSLHLYIFHYYIIYSLTCEAFNNLSIGWQMLAACCISFLIILLTLSFACLFEKNRFLSYLFLGKIKQ